MDLVKKYGSKQWILIAEHLKSRNNKQCRDRWHDHLNPEVPELIKGPWTEEEDKKLLDLVEKYGSKRWTLIAEHLKSRNHKQCRKHWYDHLKPEVKKTPWTEEEESLIFNAYKQWPSKWVKIARLIPGRTDHAIKNHWHSSMKRRYEEGKGFFYTRRGKFEKCNICHEECMTAIFFKHLILCEKHSKLFNKFEDGFHAKCVNQIILIELEV